MKVHNKKNYSSINLDSMSHILIDEEKCITYYIFSLSSYYYITTIIITKHKLLNAHFLLKINLHTTLVII